MLCNFSNISHIFKEFHYKKDSMGGGISFCFAMFIKNELVGGSVLGKPRHLTKYQKCIDIRRMACLDKSPFNSESFFLGKIIKWITCNTNYDYVLSYSDLTVGHIGTIYKASNFKEIGKTAPTKFIEWNIKTYHPRSLNTDRPYSYKLRQAIKDKKAFIHTGLPKTIWLYTINKKKRNQKMDLQNFNDVAPNQMKLL